MKCHKIDSIDMDLESEAYADAHRLPSFGTQEWNAVRDAHSAGMMRVYLAAKNEIGRLEAFIINVKNSSGCPATVVVAGQVLDGRDVRVTP